MKEFSRGIKSHWRYVVLGVVAGAGLLFFIYVVTGTRAYVVAKRARDNCHDQYPLISRSIGCVTLDDTTERLRSLDILLDSTTDLYVKEGKAKRISIFIRDLVSQQWAASNENETYTPASLMKLPLLITYYKIRSLDPSIFSAKLSYNGAKSQYIEHFAAPETLSPGTYTVSDLLTRMMVDSDNAAATLLQSQINPDIFKQTIVDLGITLPVNQNTVDYMTAKTYAGILRILYNASYLNRDSSQAVLSLMSSSSFKGLAALLPQDVIVSHKFGERETISSAGPIRELHDCGIVYKDPNPYIICVMTQGSNFESLLSIIEDLSSLAYQNM
ncbi:MAG TPA: serine hydrolase [Candidatus Paceibacterota bacterium]|nr:serine hydrolase [Candidatus Paceibacterota bacterium]